MNHTSIDRMRRDQITLWVGKRHYISILEQQSDSYSEKEIALVCADIVLGILGYETRECVPLCEWFDSKIGRNEIAIDILYKDNEAEIVCKAIDKALAYALRCEVFE